VVRGPDAVWGGDVKKFTPQARVFEGVIGGPPCQVFSTMRNMPPRERSGKDSRRRVRHGAKKVNLIPEFERCVSAAAPWWFVMENVPKAPAAVVDGYAVWRAPLHNRDFGAVQMRKRAWCFGVRGAAAPVSLWRWLEMEALHCVEKERAVLASSTPGPSVRKYRTADGRTKAEPIMSGAGWKGVARAAELQGLPADFTEGLPFTAEGLHMLLGNGVPLHMGRAVAKAVREGRDRGFGLDARKGGG
jgi:DNA (cytosine-5)-methyltransferase 1